MRTDRQTWAPWLRVLRQSRRRLLVGLGLMWLTAASVIGLLTLSGWFITATGVTALLWAAGAAATLGIYVPGAGIRFFALARTVSRYLERVLNHDTVLRLLATLRMTVFEQLTGLGRDVRHRLRATEWLNRLTADIDALNALYLRLLAPPVVALAAGTLVAGLVAWFIPLWGTLLLIWWWVLVWQVTVHLALATRSSGRALAHQSEQLRAEVTDSLHGLGELLAGGHWPAHLEIIRGHISERRDRENRVDARIGRAEAQATLNLQLMVAGTLAVCLAASAEGQLSGPVAVMLPFAVLALNEVLGPLAGAASTYGQTLGAAQRLNTLASVASSGNHRSTTPETRTRPSAAAADQAIELRAIELTTSDSTGLSLAVLSPLSFHLAPGDQLAVIGPSGSGKSSLADILAGLTAPSAGTIRIGGHDLPASGWPPPHWTRQVGYLTQASDLFNDSIGVNLLLGDPDASDDRLWWALDQVALGDRIRALPDGLDTQVGEFGTRFSGGEVRRLALARVLLTDPALLILDEPFTGVDPGTRSDIIERLGTWLLRRTVVVLAHDDEAVPPMQRTLRLSP